MLIDLSHTITPGMTTYKGLPGPILTEFLSREASRGLYAPGTEFQIGRIDMVTNTGTYLDSPFHRHAAGADLSALLLEQVADLAAEVIRWDTKNGRARAIGPDAFAGRSLRGKAVLIDTGWSQHWGTHAYFEDSPHLTADAAEYLRREAVTLVGIDSLNIDDTADLTRPVHTTLLAHNILIVEHLTNLTQLPAAGARFFAVPVKITGLGSFPVRAFALLPDHNGRNPADDHGLTS